MIANTTKNENEPVIKKFKICGKHAATQANIII